MDQCKPAAGRLRLCQLSLLVALATTSCAVEIGSMSCPSCADDLHSHAASEDYDDNENRRDRWEFPTDSPQYQRARSTGMLLKRQLYDWQSDSWIESLRRNEDGSWELQGSGTRYQDGYCESSEFSMQPLAKAATCTVSWIGENLALTAAHCVEGLCQRGPEGKPKALVVFDYAIDYAGEDAATLNHIEKDNLYSCEEVVNIGSEANWHTDWAIIKLGCQESEDFESEGCVVKGREPIPYRTTPITAGEPLFIVGHPLYLPQKIVLGRAQETLRIDGETDPNEREQLLYHNMRAHIINSGSPIFDAQGNQVGIHSGGGNALAPKTTDAGCFDWGGCDDEGNDCRNWWVGFAVAEILGSIDSAFTR